MNVMIVSLIGCLILTVLLAGGIGMARMKKSQKDPLLQEHAPDIIAELAEQGYIPKQIFEPNMDRVFISAARKYVPHIKDTSAMLEGSKRYCYDLWIEQEKVKMSLKEEEKNN